MQRRYPQDGRPQPGRLFSFPTFDVPAAGGLADVGFYIDANGHMPPPLELSVDSPRSGMHIVDIDTSPGQILSLPDLDASAGTLALTTVDASAGRLALLAVDDPMTEAAHNIQIPFKM